MHHNKPQPEGKPMTNVRGSDAIRLGGTGSAFGSAGPVDYRHIVPVESFTGGTQRERGLAAGKPEALSGVEPNSDSGRPSESGSPAGSTERHSGDSERSTTLWGQVKKFFRELSPDHIRAYNKGKIDDMRSARERIMSDLAKPSSDPPALNPRRFSD